MFAEERSGRWVGEDRWLSWRYLFAVPGTAGATGERDEEECVAHWSFVILRREAAGGSIVSEFVL
jgi:hypothetical protein